MDTPDLPTGVFRMSEVPEVEIVIYGKDHGNMSPSANPDGYARTLDKAQRHFRTGMLAMRVGFKNQIGSAGTALIHHRLDDVPGCSNVLRTQEIADGWSLGDSIFFGAAAIANADCPIGVMMTRFIPTKRIVHMVAVHLGLENVAPKEGDSIIERWLRFARGPDGFESDATTTTFLVAGGIGPCCYGVDALTIERLMARYQTRHSFDGWVATKGPRTGQPSVNLGTIIKLELARCRTSVDAMHIHSACTACMLTEDGDTRAFWSNVYDQNDPDPARAKGRNLTVVGLRPRP